MFNSRQFQRVVPSNVRWFGYTKTLSYRLYGPKQTVMVIHPLIQARSKPRLTHLLEADEALGLARYVIVLFLV